MYDLQEPYRWLSDISVIETFESEALNLSDFYFTGDDYRYRFEPEARRRFIDLIRRRFDATVNCDGRRLKWETVIENKAHEVGRFLLGESTLDFLQPIPELVRRGDHEIRAKILAVTNSEAEQLGIGKSTMHYLRKKARDPKEFTIYASVRSRLG